MEKNNQCPDCLVEAQRNFDLPHIPLFKCSVCGKDLYKLPDGRLVEKKEWDEFCKPFEAGE